MHRELSLKPRIKFARELGRKSPLTMGTIQRAAQEQETDPRDYGQYACRAIYPSLEFKDYPRMGM